MYTEIIVAIYETDEDAELAVAEMLAAHVPQSAIHHHTKADMPDHGSFWSHQFGGHSSDHKVYDNALHNGGNVITVTTVPNHDIEPVMEILRRHNPIDVEDQAVSFVGIAHSPDPMAKGDEPAPPAAPGRGQLTNHGDAKIRRFLVAPRPTEG